MAFDNQLGKGKDWRKPYYDSRCFDWTCRHGGSCDWCSSNRQFASKRRMPADQAPRYNNRKPWHYTYMSTSGSSPEGWATPA